VRARAGREQLPDRHARQRLLAEREAVGRIVAPVGSMRRRWRRRRRPPFRAIRKRIDSGSAAASKTATRTKGSAPPSQNTTGQSKAGEEAGADQPAEHRAQGKPQNIN